MKNFHPVPLLVILLIATLSGISQAKVNLVSAFSNSQKVPVCFADCSSCSFTDNTCEICFDPFFIRDESGNCNISKTNLIENYRLQSTFEQKRSLNFDPSPSWFTDGATVTTKRCNPSPDNFSSSFDIMGPFQAEGVIYRRTISLHNYFAIKFMLVLIDWCSECQLNISVTNQNLTLLDRITVNPSNIQNFQNSKQQLCSDSVVDLRLSIDIQTTQKQSRQLQISFTPFNLQGTSQWGISTFTLLTGKCHPNCETCENYSPDKQDCLICKNFFSNQDSQNLCSTCLDGFRLNEAENRCQKCPIQFRFCDPTKTQSRPISCYYSQANALVSNNCTFQNNPVYRDSIYAGDKLFFGSLFSIEGKGALSFQCGEYSIIGPLNKGEIVFRNFINLPPHIAISVSANVFIIDQEAQFQKYSFLIFVEGQKFISETKTQSVIGTSNECGDPKKVQAFQTIQPTPFTPHVETKNIKIGIGADSIIPATWGLRDIRISYLVCDDQCQRCSDSGCLICPGNIQLKNMKCQSCIGGMSYLRNKCQFCSDNCLQCSSKDTCKKCFSGFYLYSQSGDKKICKRHPNYETPVLGNQGWQQMISDIPQPLKKVQGSEQCRVVEFMSENSTQEVDSIDFVVAQNKMFQNFTLKKHHKVKIEFVLMKIDDWQQDNLYLYANDLLVRNYSFSDFGNQICKQSNQTEQIRFEEITLTDDNSSMTIEFDTVAGPNKKPRKPEDPPISRFFGVGNFKIYPVACSQCSKEPFTYKVQYTVDDSLNVLVEFNRIYNTTQKEFKQLFFLQIQGQRTNEYQLIFEDSIRFWLKYNQTKEIIQKKVKVICLYPEQVVTNIQNTTDFNNDLFTERRLQESSLSAQFAKTLDSDSQSVNVLRFSPLNGRLSSLESLRTFFDVLTRLVVYIGFASFFFGCQTGCTHVMHNFQKIWVHIYIAALGISSILKVSLMGFRQCQNQNIAINPLGWQSSLPEFLYYDVPAQYELYYSDTNFFRNIYSIGVAFLILIVIYLIGFFIFRNQDNIKEDSWFWHFKVTFVHTPYFYWNSVVFYQYFTVVLACCLQFINLNSRSVSTEGFEGVNAAASIIAFIFTIVYPITNYFVLKRYKYKFVDSNQDNSQEQRDGTFIWINRYGQILFRFFNIKYLKEGINPILQSRFLYNVFRFGELWWIAIVVCFFYEQPFIQVFILMILNAFHFFFVLFSKFNRDKTFRFLKAFELLFFVGLQILILVSYTLLDTLTTQSFETMGIVGVVFIFIIILLTFIRMIYTWYQILQEYKKHTKEYSNIDDEHFWRRNHRYYNEDDDYLQRQNE